MICCDNVYISNKSLTLHSEIVPKIQTDVKRCKAVKTLFKIGRKRAIAKRVTHRVLRVKHRQEVNDSSSKTEYYLNSSYTSML